MKLYLEIKADTNDADYVHKRSEIDEELLEKFKPLIAAIEKNGKNHGHNWLTSDYRREGEKGPHEMYSEFGEELVDWFSDLVPHGEYGVHSIRRIKLLKVLEEETLL